MTADITDFDAARLRPFIERALTLYLGDPPDTDYQRGYLAALVDMWREGLRDGSPDARVIACERLLDREAPAGE